MLILVTGSSSFHKCTIQNCEIAWFDSRFQHFVNPTLKIENNLCSLPFVICLNPRHSILIKAQDAKRNATQEGFVQIVIMAGTVSRPAIHGHGCSYTV